MGGDDYDYDNDNDNEFQQAVKRTIRSNSVLRALRAFRGEMCPVFQHSLVISSEVHSIAGRFHTVATFPVSSETIAAARTF